MTAPIDDAIALAKQGLLLIPVRAGAKSPAVTGWQERATSDPDEIERLFSPFPGCNLGVITGERSGVFVLDVDTKTADGSLAMFELQVRHGDLPTTWSSLTPTPGGVHHWFRPPPGLLVRNRVGFMPGLDIRGDGGFVVVPPSVTDVGEYRWQNAPWDLPIADAPEWLLAVACSPLSSAGSRPYRALLANSGNISRAEVAAEVIRQAERVENAPPGTRNDTLNKAAAILGQLVGAGVLLRGYAEAALEVVADECGLVRDDGIAAVWATIDSGLKHGIGKAGRALT